MNQRTKIIIFDFDGTIANTVPHIINCIKKCIDKFNLKKLSDDDIQKFNGAVLKNVLKELGATDDQLAEIKKYYEDIFFEDTSDIFLYDNVIETLEELKNKGYIIALASNRGKNTMLPLLNELRIHTFFDEIVCESDVVNKKPSPDMVQLVLNKYNLKSEEAIVLGDTKFDILMAQNAKCFSCYVCHEIEENIEIINMHPNFIIHNFIEFLNLISEYEKNNRKV